MFYNDLNSSNTPRSAGALEVTMRARKLAREQASLVAEYRAEAAQKKAKATRGLFTHLLASLKIF